MSDNGFIRDVSRSLFGLGVTLPLFGARQAFRLATPSLAEWRHAARSVDDVSRVAREQLDGAWHDVVKLTRCFQEALVQFVPPTVRSTLRDPSIVPQTAVGIAERSLGALRLLPEGLVGIAASELRSKFEVFCLVADIGDILGAPDADDPAPFPLHQLVDHAYQLDPFATLWAVEGLGRIYAESALAQQAQPRGLLGPQVSSTVPEKSLLMLHAGIGLGFANDRLGKVTQRGTPSEGELDATLADVVELCVTNSLPGDVGAAFESIGLVTNTFYPDLVRQVGASLGRVGAQAVPYYWHGVGRAVYFLPLNFFPGSGEEVFATAVREAPDEEAQWNGVAGAAWAVTLVAQRDPRIMCDLYLGTFGNRFARDGAFANGVASSNIMRTDTTPGSDLVTNFLDYRPSRELAPLWNEQVLRPSQVGLREVYPVLRQEHRLGEIFRYHHDLRAVARTTSTAAHAAAGSTAR